MDVIKQKKLQELRYTIYSNVCISTVITYTGMLVFQRNIVLKLVDASLPHRLRSLSLKHRAKHLISLCIMYSLVYHYQYVFVVLTGVVRR